MDFANLIGDDAFLQPPCQFSTSLPETYLTLRVCVESSNLPPSIENQREELSTGRAPTRMGQHLVGGGARPVGNSVVDDTTNGYLGPFSEIMKNRVKRQKHSRGIGAGTYVFFSASACFCCRLDISRSIIFYQGPFSVPPLISFYDFREKPYLHTNSAEGPKLVLSSSSISNPL